MVPMEDANSVSGGAMRRALIKQAGGVRKLIGLIDPNLPKEDEVPRVAKAGNMLWKLTSSVVATVGDDLARSDEVGSQKIIDVGVQTAAASALSDLAKGDEDMQDAIIQQGGVPPLLSLVRSGGAQAQEHAARAIWHLATSTDNQDIIVENGSIPELVVLIREGSTAAQEVGAAVLSELAHGAVSKLEHELALEKAEQADKRVGGGAVESASSASVPGSRESSVWH